MDVLFVMVIANIVVLLETRVWNLAEANERCDYYSWPYRQVFFIDVSFPHYLVDYIVIVVGQDVAQERMRRVI